ncbi:MAG: cytochrome c [Acidobacteria bacterium]|nr:cytochrome c [Acidobacteriota bacterium]
MRNFALGVILTFAGLFAAALIVAQFGYIPTRADATPPRFEEHLAMNALDASMERHAPRATNPLPATDDNLIDGIKIYSQSCSLCHGTMDYKPSILQHSLYPPPPQLLLDPMDDPEWHIYYAIRTGVRYTGMPAWNHALSDTDIWKVTAFLSRVAKLSPGVQLYWKKTYGVAPESRQSEEHHGAHEHED